MATLTRAQIAALAPDTPSIVRAQAMASPHRWHGGGQSERALWGRCQGAELYDVVVDLRDLGSRCTCPSRKQPCKHALALLMLSLAGLVGPGTPPAAVDEWLAGREPRARRETTPDPEARQKRAADRETKIAAGLDELARWLDDLVRQGIANAPSQPWSFWDQAAARLVDAQAPGLARRVRALYGAASSGDGWPGRVAERLGLLHALVTAYRRQASLPEEHRADVRSLVGWTHSQDELLAGPGARDRWHVVGARVEEDERYRSQRTWLLGRDSGRSAVVLSFAAAQAPLDNSLVPGTAVDAELVFYPGAAPLRALVRARGDAAPFDTFPAHATIDAATDAFAAALAKNPWLETFPLPLAAVTPVQRGDGFWLRDRHGAALPLARRFEQAWPLHALAGGHPIAVFGEWDGEALWPLGALAGGEYEEL